MACRFGGVKFPPMIYFKVFLCNKNGEGVKYITGRRMIGAYPLVSAFPNLIMGYTYTHNRFTALLNFVWDYSGEPAPEM